MILSKKEKAGSQIYLWVEWTVLFIFVPVALRIWWQPGLLFILLYLITALTAVWLTNKAKFSYREFWRSDSVRDEIKQLKRMLIRFFACSVLLLSFVVFVYPEKIFSFPRERTILWLAIMIFYPLLSVYPQELIYRAFFFERYKQILPTLTLAICASAVAFGLMHLIFRNPVAVILTLVGGVFFAETYAQTRSLRLVWLEHTLYGCLILTIGLGEFFYHGRVQ
jgi:membrane protease YdiL (CAAX protease family)